MGSTLSKRASSKITPPTRKYPLRPPPPPHHPAPAPTTKPSAKSNNQTNPPAKLSSDHAAPTAEPLDPQYAASLRRLGPVTPPDPFSTSPNPTTTITSSFSPHRNPPPPHNQARQSIFPAPSSLTAAAAATAAAQANPAVQVLNRRQDIQRAAEAEFADTLIGEGTDQRTFLDVVTLRRVLVLRDRGVSGGEIEREMGLREGLVGRLGRKGVVRAAGGGRLVDKA